jgi:hypothetical protein
MAPIYHGFVSTDWVDELPSRLEQIEQGMSEHEVLQQLGRAGALSRRTMTHEVLTGDRINVVHELVEHNDDWTMLRHRYDLELLYHRPEGGAEPRFISGKLARANSWWHRDN